MTKPYVPDLKMTEERRARMERMTAEIIKSAVAAADVAQANDGQLHVKVQSPVYWNQDYMPPGLTVQGLELAEMHKLDHSSASVRAHGTLAFDRMVANQELRKVNTVVSNGAGADVVATTYREFTTHNPQKPDEKVVIPGHTNVAFRMVGMAGTSDMMKSKTEIVDRFRAHFDKV